MTTPHQRTTPTQPSESKKKKKRKPRLTSEDVVKIYAPHFPGVVAEHSFHPERKWKFDLAFPQRMVAVEIEGGGRHLRISGYLKDLEKYTAAQLMGWWLYRVTPRMVENGEAYAVIKRALLAATLWKFTDRTDDCWVWMGARTGGNNGDSYGAMRGADGKTIYAHRATLLVHGIELNSSFTVDHLCRNKLCVRPDHLEQVTRGENARRALHTDLCPRGHKKQRAPSGIGWCPECQRQRRAGAINT